MTFLHDFKKGQKKFKRDDFQKLGRAAKQILNMSVGRGLNRIETRFGSAIWPTRQKKQEAPAAASGAVQPFMMATGTYHIDAWWARPLVTVPPTSSELSTTPTAENVWVMKPPNLRGTGLHDVPILRGTNSTPWYRYRWIGPTFQYREIYTGSTSSSQPTRIRVERINPGYPDGDINGNSYGPVVPEDTLYRIRLQYVIWASPIVDSQITINGSPVEWADMNVNARHWVTWSSDAGDNLTKDFCGVF